VQIANSVATLNYNAPSGHDVVTYVAWLWHAPGDSFANYVTHR